MEAPMDEWTALLVDDEPEFVSTLAERLQLRGISVITASDGNEALALVEEFGPQVVVLDLVMPGVSGLEVLRSLRANHPDVEVILLTGRGGTSEGIEGMRLGAFDYLMKPIPIDELMESMRKARHHQTRYNNDSE
jgi:DNA-binding response OmpR family regulator